MKEYLPKKNWLRYRLFFIESLVFLLPSITMIYLFLNKNIFFELPQMVIISSILLLILAGLITLRHIFDKFYQIINVITDSKSINTAEVSGSKDHENNLNLITSDLKSLMENFELKTTLLDRKTRDLHIVRDIIKLLGKTEIVTNLPDILLEKAMRLTYTGRGAVLFSDPCGGRAHLITHKGMDEPACRKDLINSLKPKFPGISSLKKHLVVENSSDKNMSDNDKNTSKVYLSFFIKQNIVGTVFLEHRDPHRHFEEDQVEILNILIDETVLAMEKIRLKGRLNRNIKKLELRTNESLETKKNLENEIRIRKFIEEEKERLQSQLHVAQKLEALGTLAGGIAHNFNNLLMGIQGNATLIHLSLDNDSPVYKRAKNIEKLVKSGSKLTSQLLGYARKGQYEMTAINLNFLIKDICDTFTTTKKEIVIHEDLYEDIYMTKADANQIEQVLFNLFVNAADAMSEAGHIYVSTRNCGPGDFINKPYKPNQDYEYLLLTIRDTGEGMSEEVKERVFEPFFTTKAPGKGTGLGLASCYGIIKGHGGFIDVDSEPGKGATFRIYLPASDKRLIEHKESDEQIKRGSGKILVIDDEELILEVSVTIVKELGYSVLAAKSGKEAVELFRKSQNEIDVVILDMVMPDLSGEEVFELISEIDPDVKVLLASGYTLNKRVKALIDRGCTGFIKKPYSIAELSNKLNRIAVMEQPGRHGVAPFEILKSNRHSHQRPQNIY